MSQNIRNTVRNAPQMLTPAPHILIVYILHSGTPKSFRSKFKIKSTVGHHIMNNQ